MKFKTLVAVVCAMMTLAMVGCTFVRPSDASLLDTTASNARAFNTKVQARADVPADVKTWLGADADQWSFFASWANGRAPATTQP